MNDKLISESVNRNRLLMGYKSDLTLSENIDKLPTIEVTTLTEQSYKAILKSLFTTSDDAAIMAMKNTPKYLEAATLFDDLLKTGVNITDDTGRILNSSDEIISSLSKGALKSKTAISSLAKSLLKSGKVTGKLRVKLTDRAAELMIKKNPNITRDQVRKSLIKKNYDPAIADEIANKVAVKQKNLVGGGKVGKSGKGKGKGKGKAPNPNQKSLLKKWKKSWNSKKRGPIPWKTIARWAGILGVTAMIVYAWLSDVDEDENHDCPSGKMWDETKGKCVPITPDPVDPDPVTPIYSNCNGFPYRKGCISPIIGEVQKCLGLSVDNKFGPNTVKGLSSNNYGNEITEPIYNEIKKKCSTIPTPVPTPIPLTPEQNYGIDPNPIQKETGVGYEEISITDIK
jgi:hypothetical protein